METSKYDKELYLNKRKIGINEKTYFIADIAANHDGDLNRALDLIHLAKNFPKDFLMLVLQNNTQLLWRLD